jgi:hypothetical protein
LTHLITTEGTLDDALRIGVKPFALAVAVAAVVVASAVVVAALVVASAVVVAAVVVLVVAVAAVVVASAVAVAAVVVASAVVVAARMPIDGDETIGSSGVEFADHPTAGQAPAATADVGGSPELALDAGEGSLFLAALGSARARSAARGR